MNEWHKYWDEMLGQKYLNELDEFVQNTYDPNLQRSEGAATPAKENVYKAMQMVTPNEVRVTILGQDPYPNPAFATGMAFSVPQGTRLPQSLRNMYQEAQSKNLTGDLSSWAQQGVMLLNTALTFNGKENQKISYKMWQPLTDAVIKIISDTQSGTVFMLWGAEAHKKEKLIDTQKHLVIKTVHPSPLSAYRGFFGSGCFTEANDYLRKNNKTTIQW